MVRRRLSFANKAARALWQLTWLALYRPSPVPLHGWRRALLRLFGASIGRRARPYPSVKIWAPWHLVMAEDSCLGPHVDCYSVDTVELGAGATVSQYSYLCTASHDYTSEEHPLVTAPIRVRARAWVAADVFVGPGVTIEEGAVVLARATVVKDVGPWAVVGGCPARFIKKRELE